MNIAGRAIKLVICILVMLLVASAYSIIFAWSPICCWDQEIGLDTARMRSTTYLFWMRVSVREEPTLLSEILKIPQSSAEIRWKTVNTFSPGCRYSPHYSFHGALCQISELETCWIRHHFSQGAKFMTAHALLSRWNLDGDYHGADKLLNALRKYVFANSVGNQIGDADVERFIEVQG